jgi:hypothetical protein
LGIVGCFGYAHIALKSQGWPGIVGMAGKFMLNINKLRKDMRSLNQLVLGSNPSRGTFLQSMIWGAEKLPFLLIQKGPVVSWLSAFFKDWVARSRVTFLTVSPAFGQVDSRSTALSLQ